MERLTIELISEAYSVQDNIVAALFTTHMRTDSEIKLPKQLPYAVLDYIKEYQLRYFLGRITLGNLTEALIKGCRVATFQPTYVIIAEINTPKYSFRYRLEDASEWGYPGSWGYGPDDSWSNQDSKEIE